MKIVLTNDDGFDAPGLAALLSAAGEFGETIVVAPSRQFSGCSHQVTTAAPMELHRVADGRYELTGTPVDCTRVALTHLVTDADLVLSGINAGANLGADAFISGTVAAVREAALLGCPAIALSQYMRKEIPLSWPRAIEWARVVLRELLESARNADGGDAPSGYWNVNFPCVTDDARQPELVHCPLDVSAHDVRFRRWGGDADRTEHAQGPAPRRDVPGLHACVESGDTTTRLIYSGKYDERPRAAGRDVDICFGGDIAISRVRLE